MPKSKKRGGAKAHAKRVSTRNAKIQSEKNKIKDIQRRMLEQIMFESQQGMFDNTQEVSSINEETENGGIELEL